jgi:hypothetical protein
MESLKMIRFAVAALAFATAPAFAQTTAPAPAPAPAASAPPPGAVQPPPAFITAAQGFGQCISRNSAAAPATATPEAAAKTVLAGCATEKASMSAQFEAWIASDSFPAAGRDMARQQFAGQMNNLEPQVAARIREARAAQTTAPAAPAAPAPAPSATPRR